MHNLLACQAPYILSSSTTTLTQGQTISLAVTSTTNSIISVWIDYNQNDFLESSEWRQVTSASNTNVPATINITVPATALTGQTRMRIRSRASGSPNGGNDACTVFASGSTVDFNVNIVSPCTPPAVPVVSITAGNPVICGSGSVTLTATGGSNYLWSTGETTNSITVSSTGSYSVVNIVPPCTSATSNAVSVIVYPAPNQPTITVTGQAAICDAQPVTLSANGGAAGEVTQVSTFVGRTTTGFQNGTGTAAAFNFVTGIAQDAAGNQYIGDVSNNAIRKVTPLGVVTTLAGSGTPGFTNGTGSAATFNQPHGVAVDPAGNIYAADYNNNAIRKITQLGEVTTLATNLLRPIGIVYNPVTNTLLVSLTDAHRIVEVSLTGAVTNYAGTGTAGNQDGNLATATFNTPTGMAVSAAGDVFIACQNAHTIRKISGNTVTTIAGAYLVAGSTNGNALTSARFNRPVGVALDAFGDLYILDRNNLTVRRLRGNTVATVAGSGATGSVNGAPLSASFDGVYCILAGMDGNVYVGQSNSVRMLRLEGNATYLWSDNSTGQTLTVTNAGTYTVRAIANGCTSVVSDPTIVNIGTSPGTPTISASGPTTFPFGGSVVLTASGSGPYLWSTGDTTQSITVQLSGTFTCRSRNSTCTSAVSNAITVTVTNAYCIPDHGNGGVCRPTDYISKVELGTTTIHNITECQLPYVLSTRTATVIRGRSIPLAVTSTANSIISVWVDYDQDGLFESTEWQQVITSSGANVAALINLNVPAGATLGSTRIRIRSRAAGNFNGSTSACTAFLNGSSIDFNVTIADPCPAPPMPTISVTAGSTLICGAGSVTLTARGGTSYAWSTGSTDSTITVSAAGTYTVVSVLAGCSSEVSNAITVQVNPVPNTPSITSNGTPSVCGGQPVTLSVAGPSVGSLTTVSTVAGATSTGFSDGTGPLARFSFISGVAQDAAGNFYVGDASNARIRRITPAGDVTTFAGTGITGFANGAGSVATFNLPYGVAIDPAGNLYVADYGNNAIRKISPSGTVSTLVTGIIQPIGLVYNPVTDRLLVTETDRHTIKEISLSGVVSNYSGTGVAGNQDGAITSATFNTPTGMAVNSAGEVFVACQNANTIRKIVGNVVTTVAGTNLAGGRVDGDALTVARFNRPVALAVDPSGDLYILDRSNIILRRLRGNTVTTVAGTGSSGSTDGAALAATFSSPYALTLGNDGNLYLGQGNSLRKLTIEGSETYLWSNNETGVSISTTQGGTYTVATIARGCTSALSAPVVVTVGNIPPTPTIIASGATNICSGESVTLKAPAGYSYLWSNGATTDSIMATTTGSYTVRLISNGCTSATSAPVVVAVTNTPPTPSIVASGPTALCSGSTVVLSAPAGYSYLWSNGANTRDVTISTAGTYTLQLVSGSCTSATSAPVTVTVGTTPAQPVIIASGPVSICSGESVTLKAPAGFSYLWSNGATTDSIVVTTAGSYTLRTISTSCTSATSTPVVVSVTNTPPTPTIVTSGTTALCSGSTVVLSAPAGYSYLWSNGANTRDVTISTAGTYTLQLVSGSCTSATSAPVTVTVGTTPAQPVITASGPVSICSGESVTLKAPAGFSYLWSNGATTDSIVVTTAGTYSVRTISGSCTSATSAAIVVAVGTTPVTPVIFATGPLNICTGGTAMLTAPAGFGYLWSTGETTKSIFVGTAGTYTVRTITGTCTSAVSNALAVTVSPPPATPVITPVGAPVICGNGFALLEAPAGFRYLWSNNDTTQQIRVTTPGTYTVQVITGGCSSAASLPVAVTAQQRPVASILAINDTMVAFPAGATYQWILNGLPLQGQTSQGLRALVSGAYQVIVTQNGCSDTSAISNITSLSPKGVLPTLTLRPNPATTSVQLHLTAGSFKGVSIVDQLGRTVLTTTTLNGDLLDISSLAAGTYVVKVSTENGIATQRLAVVR